MESDSPRQNDDNGRRSQIDDGRLCSTGVPGLDDVLGRGMVRLVNDLMEVSRITRGKIELRMADVALEQVIHDALELSRALLDARHQRFEIRLAETALAVHGDAVRLTQVFANLLNNAAKYTPEGGRIEIILSREHDEAVVAVQDDGAGIANDMLGSIFDRFVQVSGTAKAAQGGLGIGLTLVKTLVELHGGRVSASSPGLNQGSRFEVRLPLLASHQAPAPGDPGAAHQPLSHFGHILVVDDNRDAADSLRLLLTLLGASTSVAYDGQHALQLAAATPPAVAILDIGMPGMDGCELARQLRADPRHAGLVLIALTGWGQDTDHQRIFGAGFDRHLLKPVGMQDLTRALEQVTDRQHQME